jgi:hypothetical protein
MSEDGWNKVGMTGRTSRCTVDTTKLKAAKEDAIILGNVGQFRDWSGGANTKGKDANKRPVTSGGNPTYSPNMYAALDTSTEDGKRPLPLSRYSPIVICNLIMISCSFHVFFYPFQFLWYSVQHLGKV